MIMLIIIYVHHDHDVYDHKISLPSQLKYLSIHGQDNEDDDRDGLWIMNILMKIMRI